MTEIQAITQKLQSGEQLTAEEGQKLLQLLSRFDKVLEMHSKVLTLTQINLEALKFYANNIFERKDGTVAIQTVIEHDAGKRARAAVDLIAKLFAKAEAKNG